MTQREETNAMKRCVTFVRGAVDGSVHGAEWQQAATKTFCETNQLLPVDSVVLRNLSAKSPETRAALEALMGRKVLRNDFDAIVVTLHWPIEGKIADVEDITYNWSQAELRALDLDKKLVDGQVRQIANLDPSQPWGIFILEFKNVEPFLAERGMTSTLRKVLRGLVPSRRKEPGLSSWKREHLLFICTHKYEHFRFAYFKTPPEDANKTAPLAAFGWGPDIPARTACEFNLPALEWPDDPGKTLDWIAKWASGFDVEKVTRKFYADYAAEFEHLRKAVKGITGEEQKMFTQTLLNRLMFLRFIERKGWLTPPGGDTSNDYLRLLYEAGGYRGKSFYTGRLTKLFFEALAVEGKQESEAVGRVPFLNGGLFERAALDDKVEDIVDEAFAPLLSQDGLFYRYNFTVQESTPLNIEVAVDPEMLGKVFEELVTGRHESGSYYTPRAIVSFMCREALKGHLISAANIAEEKIAAFVDRHETPFGIEEAKAIAAALDNLRAVDPACGSGAYLLGLLHEMVDLYQLLYSDKLKKDDRELHKIKLNIIEKSLYGVDKDPFATNVAMLRLWLSLSVDSENPQSLPNLDFKIETGDSVTGPDPQGHADVTLAEPAARLAAVKGKYMVARGEWKKTLREQINKAQKEIAFQLQSLSPGAIDWRVQFCEVFFSDRAGFDIVLANPPYIRQELIKDLKPALKRVYKAEFSGTADLYVFFYLRALQLLAPSGMLVFISSNKWFRAGYGQKLRAVLARAASVRTILDFHDLPVFESAIAYPMIFVAAKAAPPADHVATLAEPPTLDPPYPDVAAVVAKYGHKMPPAALGKDGAWHLATSTAAGRLTKMRAAGPTLGEYIGGRMYRGVLTGLNEAWIDSTGQVYVKGDERPRDAVQQGVFVIDGARRAELISADPKSAEIIKPLAMGKDIKRWRVESRDKWLVFTRRGIDIKAYPAIYDHLKQFKRDLTPKHRNDPPEKPGRKPGSYKWFEVQDEIAYFAEFSGPKIILPDISPEPRFALAPPGMFSNDTTFIIPGDDRYVMGVLNSTPVAEFYLEISAQVRGGYTRYKRIYFEQIPIPTASPTDRAAIAVLSQKCLDAKGVGCEAWEKEIDDRVMALYGL